jgi:hypothetical protein
LSAATYGSRFGVPPLGGLELRADRAGIVARMSARDLGKVDAGTWFKRKHPLLARREHERQFVPTLDQVFVRLKCHPNGPGLAYIELKTDRAETTATDLANAVAELIKLHDSFREVVAVSFNLKALAHIKAHNPSIITGALFEPQRDALRIIHKHSILSAALDCGADQLLPHRLIVTRRMVAAPTESKLPPSYSLSTIPNSSARRPV